MTGEEIRIRFNAIKDSELCNGSPANYSARVARKTVLKELMENGFSNSEAVFRIYKAVDQNFEEAILNESRMDG